MIRAAHAGFGVAAILAVASIRFLAAVVAAALSYIDFAADDGLDVALASFIKEIGSSKEIAVIGDGYGGHLLAGRILPKPRRIENTGRQKIKDGKPKKETKRFVQWNPILHKNG